MHLSIEYTVFSFSNYRRHFRANIFFIKNIDIILVFLDNFLLEKFYVIIIHERNILGILPYFSFLL